MKPSKRIYEILQERYEDSIKKRGLTSEGYRITIFSEEILAFLQLLDELFEESTETGEK